MAGLTPKRIAKLIKQKAGRHRDNGPIKGLHLQVSPGGTGSWLLRYEIGGRERWHGLGPIAIVSLKEARERARAARLKLLDGTDPIEARKAERAARALEAARTITFEAAAKKYFEAHEAGWKNRKHRAQFLSTLATYAFPKVGKLAVAEIDTGLVLRVIEPIWQDKTATANRVRSRIEAVLDWATVRGYRTGDNPARWKGHLAEVLPARGKIQKVIHHPALPFTQIGSFMADLRDREGVAARALEFTVLVAARTSETIGAQWPEIDIQKKVWNVPVGRMKADKPHRVPLSDAAIKLLEKLPREENNPFVFIGDRRAGLSNGAMASVINRINASNAAAGRPKWIDPTVGREIVPHGFRSSLRDWAAETTGYPNHVVEMALAHAVSDEVEAAYRRGDLFAKRVRLMADWARYCGNPAQADSKVVALRS